jgi:alkylation response protein AidB-like acyl-CoA dehydrogenase
MQDRSKTIPSLRQSHSVAYTARTQDGFTVMLIERGPGVETKQIKTAYSSTAGTAYITFDNVRVPVENTLGPEGGGIFVILSNFNHEVSVGNVVHDPDTFYIFFSGG